MAKHTDTETPAVNHQDTDVTSQQGSPVSSLENNSLDVYSLEQTSNTKHTDIPAEPNGIKTYDNIYPLEKKQAIANNNPFKPGDSKVFDIGNGIYAIMVSGTFAELARGGELKNIPPGGTGNFGLSRTHAANFAFFSSFFENFPLSIIFGYKFVIFLIDTKKSPWINSTALVFALLPAVIGITLGYDGVGEISSSPALKAFGAGLMGWNMLCTRAYGFLALCEKIKDALITPWQIRKNKPEFMMRVLLKLIEEYPSYTIDIMEGLEKDEFLLGDDSINCIVKQVTQLSSTSAIHRTWNTTRKMLTMGLSVAVISTLPLFRLISEKGWNHIHSGLGNIIFLREATAIANFSFYLKASSEVLDTVIDRFFVPLLQSFWNTRSSTIKNLLRLIIPLTLIFCSQVFAFESGMSMGSEATGVDLSTQMWGIFQFLTPIKGKVVQFFAGSAVNNFSFASFCMFLSLRQWFKNSNEQADGYINRLLCFLGAREPQIENNENQALINGNGIANLYYDAEIEKPVTVSKDELLGRLKRAWDTLNSQEQKGGGESIHTAFITHGHRPRLSFLGFFGIKVSGAADPVSKADLDEDESGNRVVSACINVCTRTFWQALGW